jgi:hypothetical protein
MKYIARVKQVTATGVHKWASKDANGKLEETDMPSPGYVVVDAGDGVHASCMMYRFKDGGTFCGDTWHKNFAEAKKQAQYEYGLTDEDWRIHKSM